MNHRLVFKYERETLYWATKAFQEDKLQNFMMAEEYYSKAIRSMSCAISFTEDDLSKRVMSNMLKTYECRLLFIQELKKKWKEHQHRPTAYLQQQQQQQQQAQFSQTTKLITTTTTTTTSSSAALKASTLLNDYQQPRFPTQYFSSSSSGGGGSDDTMDEDNSDMMDTLHNYTGSDSGNCFDPYPGDHSSSIYAEHNNSSSSSCGGSHRHHSNDKYNNSSGMYHHHGTVNNMGNNSMSPPVSRTGRTPSFNDISQMRTQQQQQQLSSFDTSLLSSISSGSEEDEFDDRGGQLNSIPSSNTLNVNQQHNNTLFNDCVVTRDDTRQSIGFKHIVGLEEAIRCLREAVILPQQHPMLFRGSRQPWRAILLYGPPGTGKTLLARALAHECQATYFSVSSADLLSKWMGQSEKMVKELFKKAHDMRPSIIFIDEIDSLCSTRNDQDNETTRRVKTELLVQMQGLGQRDTSVFVLAATNLPWQLDSAVRRRFEKRIYIPLPDTRSIRQLIESNLIDTPHNITEEQLEMIASRLNGYSCSDIGVVCRSALMEPIRKLESCEYFVQVGQTRDGTLLFQPSVPDESKAIRKVLSDFKSNEQISYTPEVSLQDFETSMQKNKSSISQEDIDQCHRFTREYGQ